MEVQLHPISDYAEIFILQCTAQDTISYNKSQPQQNQNYRFQMHLHGFPPPCICTALNTARSWAVTKCIRHTATQIKRNMSDRRNADFYTEPISNITPCVYFTCPKMLSKCCCQSSALLLTTSLLVIKEVSGSTDLILSWVVGDDMPLLNDILYLSPANIRS